MRLLALPLLAGYGTAQQYVLQNSFQGPTFFDNFDFWTAGDPTFGYVHYVDQAVAEQYGMINSGPNTVTWGVDTTQVLDPTANLGRLSIRLTSIESWTHGLFILDLEHMPANQCGVWPAFWTFGSGTWPTNGEIDIIEFTNNLPNNLMALHTTPTPNCTVAGANQTGTLLTDDCGAGDGYTGCGVSATAPNNIGYSFDSASGGVYAMEWTSVAIQIWFFPHDQVPASILNANETIGPDPSTFGLPIANFEGTCDIDAHFFNHSIVFDTTFCGTYAGNTWGVDGCPLIDPANVWQSCNDFVAANPQAYTDAYWEVNYLNVYQTVSGGPSSTTSTLSSVTPAAQTSSVDTVLSGAQGRPTTPTMSFPVSLTGPPSSDILPSSTLTSSIQSTSPNSNNPELPPTSPNVVPSAGTATPTSSEALTAPGPVSPTPVSSIASSGLSSDCTADVCIVTTEVVVVQTVIVVDVPADASPQMNGAGQLLLRDVDPAPPSITSDGDPTVVGTCVGNAGSAQTDMGRLYSIDPFRAPETPPNCVSPRGLLSISEPTASASPSTVASPSAIERDAMPDGDDGCFSWCGACGTSCQAHRELDEDISDNEFQVEQSRRHRPKPVVSIPFDDPFQLSPREKQANDAALEADRHRPKPVVSIPFDDPFQLSPREKQANDAALEADRHRPKPVVSIPFDDPFQLSPRKKRTNDAALEADRHRPKPVVSIPFDDPFQLAPRDDELHDNVIDDPKNLAMRQDGVETSIDILTVWETYTVPFYVPTLFSYDPPSTPSASPTIFAQYNHPSDTAETAKTTPPSSSRSNGMLASATTSSATHGSSHHISSATCTPVVMLDCSGAPSATGCLAPQDVKLTFREHMVIANSTSTVSCAARTHAAGPKVLFGGLLDETVKTSEAPTSPCLTLTLLSAAAVVLAVCGYIL